MGKQTSSENFVLWQSAAFISLFHALQDTFFDISLTIIDCCGDARESKDRTLANAQELNCAVILNKTSYEDGL